MSNQEPLFKKIKNYSYQELKVFAGEIRDYIKTVVSKNTGHLSSNLGTVELTLALYRIFDPDEDIIIWDTGHQAYTHKLLTGRYNEFETLRQKGGISGFLKRDESVYDVFGAGHVGTSIPAALGIEKAISMANEKKNIVVVIGDGALTSGISLEAINQLKQLGSKLKIVLNDNAMSISKNVGALSMTLTDLRLNPVYREIKGDIKGTLETMHMKGLEHLLSRIKDGIKHTFLGDNVFEDFGLNYVGPVDGHSIKEMEEIFKTIKEFNEPFIIHVVTQKGRGLEYAEKDPAKFHSVSKIDPETGEKIYNDSLITYSKVFGNVVAKLAEKDTRIVAITAAMPDGTGLTEFARKFPGRFYDLGITEQLCTTFAGGLSVKGAKPIFAVYSTFLQRAFDQIVHDIALQKLPVIFAIDRAGIVGHDGATHNGVFDIAYLNIIPNMKILAPSSLQELANMFYSLLLYEELDGPVAIRYPRQSEYGILSEIIENMSRIKLWKWEKLINGKEKIAVLATGSMVQPAREVAAKYGLNMYNCRAIKPLDTEALDAILEENNLILTVEEGIKIGGFGTSIMLYANSRNYSGKFHIMGIDDEFSEHGTRMEILKDHGLDFEGLESTIKKLRGEMNAYNHGIRKDRNNITGHKLDR
ncbi:1-deoxy-D-xylulose-5-phosphate synthase [Kosmotoga arenicorallina S304]|uniref:1-deoxy-D-xylulose-5-phosphate synthase n=1 Tax=Kosmotoga arenicorallina S304 TaxID=1453497 RepID=A0A182C7Q2_9BACT|nr:1-deoxy-D-xylulose-5-phosphate synthase [Kosmotoga arenicorallina]OAA31720.1 1-deoxy-D-xylulose-5-phosphate synthase [Kosmotoga arenicorallina S304]